MKKKTNEVKRPMTVLVIAKRLLLQMKDTKMLSLEGLNEFWYEKALILTSWKIVWHRCATCVYFYKVKKLQTNQWLAEISWL